MLGGELQCAAVAQRAGSFTLALGWEGNFTLGGVCGGVCAQRAGSFTLALGWEGNFTLGGVGGGVWSPSVSAHQLTAGS